MSNDDNASGGTVFDCFFSIFGTGNEIPASLAPCSKEVDKVLGDMSADRLQKSIS